MCLLSTNSTVYRGEEDGDSSTGTQNPETRTAEGDTGTTDDAVSNTHSNKGATNNSTSTESTKNTANTDNKSESSIASTGTAVDDAQNVNTLFARKKKLSIEIYKRQNWYKDRYQWVVLQRKHIISADSFVFADSYGFGGIYSAH